MRISTFKRGDCFQYFSVGFKWFINKAFLIFNLRSKLSLYKMFALLKSIACQVDNVSQRFYDTYP